MSRAVHRSAMDERESDGEEHADVLTNDVQYQTSSQALDDEARGVAVSNPATRQPGNPV